MEEKEFKIIVREVTTKDGKKKFKSFKFVDEENQRRLIDCVICKSVDDGTLDIISSSKKVKVTGEVHVERNAYEYPKAFVRKATNVVVIN